MMVCGDFNFPDIVWTHDDGFTSGKIESSFIENLEEQYFTQCFDFLTFFYGNNDKYIILDLLITSDPERVLVVRQLPPIGDSNKAHAVLEWNFAVKNDCIENKTRKRLFRKANFDGITMRLRHKEWYRLRSCRKNLYEKCMIEDRLACREVKLIPMKRVGMYNQRLLDAREIKER